MNRFGMALGAGVIGIALIVGCGDSTDDPLDPTESATSTLAPTESATLAPTESATTEPTETATNEPVAVEDSIVDGVIFDQEVAVGTTIVWTNEDDEARTITSDDGVIDSGEIAPGETFEYMFDEAGSWVMMVDGTESATITVS